MKPNVYSGGDIDRAAFMRRDENWLLARYADPRCRLVPMHGTRALVRRANSLVRAALPRRGEVAGLAERCGAPLFLGMVGDEAHFALDLTQLPEAAAPPELERFGEFAELRGVGAVLPAGEAALLAYARGLTHWHRSQLFCGRCGRPTESRQGGHVLACTDPACGTEHFPRTDPAIIVLVTAGDRCLLGRQARWTAGMFSTLAGFVEPGESLEETVAREVMEETGVRVARTRYHSSQPWPFPASLMLGFIAEAEHIVPPRVDPHELEAAAWFSRADIAAFGEQGRRLPGEDSIARRLIEEWLHQG